MGLLDLSEDQIRKAFQKTRDEFNITDGKLVLITEEFYDAALAFGRDVFTNDEPITRAFQVKWTTGREKTWKSNLQQKISLMLLNEENGDVMAIRTMFIVTDTPLVTVDTKAATETLTASDNAITHTLDDPGMVKLKDYLRYCHDKARPFESFGVREAIQLHAIAVDPKYRKRGLAGKVFTAALKMIEYFGLDSVCVFGEAHSPAPKKLFERARFECLFELPHDQYVVDGKQIIGDTGGSTKVYGLKIQKT